VAPPIYQTATFWAEDAEQFAQVAVNRRGADFYTRYGNPNHAQVSAVVAELEHTEAAMVTASGMAALTTAVLALVSAGDHVIGQKSTYGGTASVLLNLLPRLGVSTSLVDQTDPEAFERALTPQTRLILVESPSNPLLQAGSQMSGFGGVLGIELVGGSEAADAFLGRLRYARRSASLGGVDSLAVHPASMWRGMLSEDQIAASGVPLDLVRLAAGTEDTPDLVADALAAADALLSDSPDNLGEGLIP
jgi:cystathionine beta-lyase/cystathionine gamma-synthase